MNHMGDGDLFKGIVDYKESDNEADTADDVANDFFPSFHILPFLPEPKLWILFRSGLQALFAFRNKFKESIHFIT